MTNQDIISFIRTMEPTFDGVLGEIQNEALALNIPIIPQETAALISVILSVIKPIRALEIGTAVGFSAGLICKYLDHGGKLITIDRYDIMIKEAKKNFERLGIADKVTLLEGDAANILPTINEEFDFIFLDAAKGQYITYLPELIRLLKKGGVLVSDDVLQNGAVVQNRYSIKRRQRTIHTRMRNFLWEITHNKSLLTSIIPIGAGLALSYKIN